MSFLGACLAVLLVLALYGFWYEPASLRAVVHTIALDEATRLSQTPLRVVVIADLHGGAPFIDEAKIEKVVTLANAAKPDLVLLTGDYVISGVRGGHFMPIETIAGKMRALSAPLGVYAVLGNHDRSSDARRIEAAFSEVGIHVLENQAVKLKHGGTFYLAGLSDWYTGPRDIKGMTAQLPAGAHALCFTHSPDIFPLLPRTCALTIAGHTHGGQVFLPFFGRPIVPSLYGQRYAAGLVHENGKYLFVSTGIGTSNIPVRFGVPPEVSVLDIH